MFADLRPWKLFSPAGQILKGNKRRMYSTLFRLGPIHGIPILLSLKGTPDLDDLRMPRHVYMCVWGNQGYLYFPQKDQKRPLVAKPGTALLTLSTVCCQPSQAIIQEHAKQTWQRCFRIPEFWGQSFRDAICRKSWKYFTTKSPINTSYYSWARACCWHWYFVWALGKSILNKKN